MGSSGEFLGKGRWSISNEFQHIAKGSGAKVVYRGASGTTQVLVLAPAPMSSLDRLGGGDMRLRSLVLTRRDSTLVL